MIQSYVKTGLLELMQRTTWRRCDYGDFPPTVPSAPASKIGMFAMKKGSNAWCGWWLIQCGVAIPAKCPASDLIPDLTKHYREVWQAEWMDALPINCTLSNLTLVTAALHIFLVVMLWFWKDYALVTHVLLINIYSQAIANHSATNLNLL